MKRKISLGSWAFSFGPYAENPVPFDSIVKRLSEAGYDGIEACGFPPHVSLENFPSGDTRRELVRFINSHNLGVSGYAADLSSVNPVTPGNAQRYLDLFERCVQMCVDINSPSIRVDTVAAPNSIASNDYEPAMNRIAAIWREAAGIAQRRSIRVVWEFEPGFAFNKPSEVLRLHKLVNHPNFRIMFDTCHAHMCGVVGARQFGKREVLPGGVKQFLDMLDGRIGAIHVIDSDGTLYGDDTSTHRPLGEGVIDFRGLTPKLLAVPDVEWWCIDLCFWPDAWKLVEPSLAFVRRLFESTAAA